VTFHQAEVVPVGWQSTHSVPSISSPSITIASTANPSSPSVKSTVTRKVIDSSVFLLLDGFALAREAEESGGRLRSPAETTASSREVSEVEEEAVEGVPSRGDLVDGELNLVKREEHDGLV
jgi:hypothetical protein